MSENRGDAYDDAAIELNEGDEQAEEQWLWERYIQDPPDDLVIAEPEQEDHVGISEYTEQESRRGSPPLAAEERADDTPAEEAAMEVIDPDQRRNS